jgi:hypothetical protein
VDEILSKLGTLGKQLEGHRAREKKNKTGELGRRIVRDVEVLSETAERVERDLGLTLKVLVTYDVLKHESMLGEREANVYQMVWSFFRSFFFGLFFDVFYPQFLFECHFESGHL